MCVSPTYIWIEKGPGNEQLETACGWCWSCQKNRLNDLVARCLCEASTSEWVHALTLTYRPHDKPLTPEAQKNKFQKKPSAMQTQVLHKEDFQNFQKHLRRRFKTRYLVAGEYGSKGTARTHFHAILFGTGSPPSWEHNKNTHIDFWPWGHVYCDPAVSESSIRYTAKYLLKGAKRKKTRFDNSFNKEWISYSRIPIMGIDFVTDLAARYAAEQVHPHSFKYRPPMAHHNREYQFQGEARFQFLLMLYTLWPEGEKIKKTETMERAYVRFVKERQKRAFEALPISEQIKLLDTDLRPSAQLSQRDLRLYGRFLYERLSQNGKRFTIAEYAQAYPDEYATIRAVFRRDLTREPPSYAETGIIFAA